MKKRIKFLIFCFPFLCIFSLHAQNIIASNDSTLDLVGVWASGATYAVEMENGISYCGVGHYFKIFDFGYQSIMEYGQLALNTTIADIEVEGSYAYVVNDTAGLIIIDISNLGIPVQVGHYFESSHFHHAHDVLIRGSYAYLAYGGLGLKIIDITDPTNPTEVGNCTATTACYSVDVSGNFAYITDLYGKLYIVDISNPANPFEAGYYNSHGIYFEHIAISGDYACIAGGTEGLRMLNVSKRDSIYEVGFYDTPDRAGNIMVEDNYAFVSDRESGLMIFDISTPGTPTLARQFDTEGCVRDVSVEGDSILLADESNGIRVLYGLTSTDSLRDGTYYNPGDKLTGISVRDDGNQVYVSDRSYGMFTLDLQQKEYPQQTGSLFLGISAANSIAHSGTYAYVGDDHKNLYVVDVTLGSHQTVLNVDTLSGVPTAMHIDGNNLFITMGMQGLGIYDISDPVNPVDLSHVDTDNYAKNVEVQGSYAYVADNTSGFYIINVADPVHPAIIKHISTKNWVNDIAVNGNYLFVAEYAEGLKVYDISDTSNVTVVDSFSMSAYATYVDVCNNYLSVVFQNMFTYNESLALFDVTDPTNIQLAYTHELWGRAAAQDLKMTSEYVFVPLYSVGLYIYKYDIPTKIVDTIIPNKIELMQNYPNPFNPSTRIEFDINEATDVTLTLYNILGQKVTTLINEYKEAGHYGLEFNASSLSSGLYFYHLTAGERSYTRKMCLIK